MLSMHATRGRVSFPGRGVVSLVSRGSAGINIYIYFFHVHSIFVSSIRNPRNTAALYFIRTLCGLRKDTVSGKAAGRDNFSKDDAQE